ncbi:MAG: hypothetical protein QM608_12955 [Caulobacter sp.]
MRRFLMSLSIVAALAGAASSAQAGEHADAMGKCLVDSTSPKDREALVLWIFSAMSSHPSVSAYAKITPEQRAAMSKQTAALMQRLIVVDCRKEAAQALREDGSDAIEQAFEVLGGTAMEGLMSDPKVAASLSELQSYMDEKPFEELLTEAGEPAAK